MVIVNSEIKQVLLSTLYCLQISQTATNFTNHLGFTLLKTYCKWTSISDNIRKPKIITFSKKPKLVGGLVVVVVILPPKQEFVLSGKQFYQPCSWVRYWFKYSTKSNYTDYQISNKANRKRLIQQDLILPLYLVITEDYLHSRQHVGQINIFSSLFKPPNFPGLVKKH